MSTEKVNNCIIMAINFHKKATKCNKTDNEIKIRKKKDGMKLVSK